MHARIIYIHVYTMNTHNKTIDRSAEIIDEIDLVLPNSVFIYNTRTFLWFKLSSRITYVNLLYVLGREQMHIASK